MLQNPAWDLFTTARLADWLRQQPADAVYDWQSPHYCLMGQYLEAQGIKTTRSYNEMPHYYEIAGKKPWTMGAALERLNKVVA